MMKEEFERIYGKEISNEEYKICEYVYTWNPIVRDKKHILELYKMGGIELVRQLVPNGKVNELEIEPKMRELRSKRDRLMRELDDISIEMRALNDRLNSL